MIKSLSLVFALLASAPLSVAATREATRDADADAAALSKDRQDFKRALKSLGALATASNALTTSSDDKAAHAEALIAASAAVRSSI